MVVTETSDKVYRFLLLAVHRISLFILGNYISNGSQFQATQKTKDVQKIRKIRFKQNTSYAYYGEIQNQEAKNKPQEKPHKRGFYFQSSAIFC